MKRIIRFSTFFIPAMIISLLLVAAGLAGYIIKGGFNLGVDFKAGLLQEVQFAPQAFSITYSGKGNAVINYSRTGLGIVITGTESNNENYTFDFEQYATLGALAQAMKQQVAGVETELSAPENAQSSWLIENTQGTPQLGSAPYIFHYLQPDSPLVDISDVREALNPLGDASVQVLGAPSERRFMIRLEDDDTVEEGAGGASADKVARTLEAKFGAGEVAVTRSDYVGSRFSKQLQEQAGLLMALTMLLILLYASFRFKPQFAIGAVLAIAHDALIMVAFITWTRMEFNTTTIAAILTILGYSINDTIVVFDRIRETSRLYQGDTYRVILDRALTETLGRTIITTFTTMLAVASLYIFTTGSMKDFALSLLIGMASGVYSTIYIASGWTLFWEKHIKGKGKKAGAPAPVSA